MSTEPAIDTVAPTDTATGAPSAGPTGEQQSAPAEFQALYDHVATCSRCGFCQPTCPIFRATGREAHVARGKVALYRNVIEERTAIGPDMKDAFSNCLLCRACTESCFSALETDKVVMSFRHSYAERFGRSFWQRRVFRSLLPRPRLMRGLVRSMWALRRTGLADAAKRAGLVGLLNPKLERALELKAGTPGPLLHARLAKRPVPASATANLGSATGCRADITTCCRRWGRRRSGSSSVWARPWRCLTTSAAGWLLMATGTAKRRNSLPGKTCAGSETSTASTRSCPNAGAALDISRNTPRSWRTTPYGPSVRRSCATRCGASASSWWNGEA